MVQREDRRSSNRRKSEAELKERPKDAVFGKSEVDCWRRHRVGRRRKSETGSEPNQRSDDRWKRRLVGGEAGGFIADASR